MKTLSLYFLIAFQQILNPILAPDFTINEEISIETQSEIISSVNSTLQKYQEVANFWDEKYDRFDEDKYLGFIELFAGDATVIDDLSFSKEIISYGKYSQIIFDKLKVTGLPFEFEKAQIKKIDIDDSGFYIIDVTLVKRIYVAINQNGKAVKLKKGRRVKVDMRIDLPDYLLTDARIQYIKESEARKMMDYLQQPVDYFTQKFQKR